MVVVKPNVNERAISYQETKVHQSGGKRFGFLKGLKAPAPVVCKAEREARSVGAALAAGCGSGGPGCRVGAVGVREARSGEGTLCLWPSIV